MNQQCEVQFGPAVARDHVVGSLTSTLVSRGTAVGRIVLDDQHMVFEAAHAEDELFPSSYATIVENILAADTLLSVDPGVTLVTSSGRAASNLLASVSTTLHSTGRGADLLDTPIPEADLTSTARASEHLQMYVTSTIAGHGVARDVFHAAAEELITSRAAASSSTSPSRRVSVVVEVGAQARDIPDDSQPSTEYFVLSTGTARAEALPSGTQAVVWFEDYVVGSDAVLFRDPDRGAYVLNVETGGVSTYQNYGFNSLAWYRGKLFGAGDDGLFVMEGHTDDGLPVRARVQEGFYDYGTTAQKRLEYMYFGYTSEDPLSLTVEVQESRFGPATYRLEARPSTSPRNTRVQPGKGLVGRYWRSTITNPTGGDFEIHSQEADVAVSKRRV